jgi:hypothetical protein
MALSMVVGRDYRLHGKHEFVIYEDEEIVTRKGFFASYTQAKRAGLKAAAEIYAERDRIAPELPL